MKGKITKPYLKIKLVGISKTKPPSKVPTRKDKEATAKSTEKKKETAANITTRKEKETIAKNPKKRKRAEVDENSVGETVSTPQRITRQKERRTQQDSPNTAVLQHSSSSAVRRG